MRIFLRYFFEQQTEVCGLLADINKFRQKIGRLGTAQISSLHTDGKAISTVERWRNAGLEITISEVLAVWWLRRSHRLLLRARITTKLSRFHPDWCLLAWLTVRALVELGRTHAIDPDERWLISDDLISCSATECDVPGARLTKHRAASVTTRRQKTAANRRNKNDR